MQLNIFLWHKLCLCFSKTRCQHCEGQSFLASNRPTAELFIFMLEKFLTVKMFFQSAEIDTGNNIFFLIKCCGGIYR